MATCQSTIRRALRSLGILSAGDEPSGSEASDGLERLQSLVLNLPGLTQNGVWYEKMISAAYTAKEGERITVAVPGVVTLPLTITYGWKTRPPRDLAKVMILGAAATTTNAGLWIYSATKGAWGQLNALGLDSELPFGSEDDEGLAAQLAVNWSDEFGASATVTQRTATLGAQSAKSFRARLKKNDHHYEYGDRLCGEPAYCDYPDA